MPRQPRLLVGTHLLRRRPRKMLKKLKLKPKRPGGLPKTARGKDVVQRWRTAISSFVDLVQTDIHGLLAKFAIEPPEISQEENVEVAELFRWIRASLAMARSGADFKCELSATVAARTLSAAVCRLLPAESNASSMGIVKAQLRLLRDSCFEWPSLDSLRPESLPTLPKNIAKNFAVGESGGACGSSGKGENCSRGGTRCCTC